MPGNNVVRWADVTAPRGAIPFEPSQILSIQFHVPANTMARGAYSFCISNLTFLTE
jgi:hypothetical protein